MSTGTSSAHSAATPAATLEGLRAQRQVRMLNPEEEGFAMSELPAGVYGFAYAPGFDEVPLFAKKSFHSFELHKAADGTEHLIGFVTPLEARALEAAQEGTPIRIYPDAWDDANCLVSVPASQIVSAKKLPSRDPGNPFSFTIA